MEKVTLQQVRADIESGKCKSIYYSSRTCWWTHLESDLEESTKMGEQSFEHMHQTIMNDPKVSDKEKQRRNNLVAALKVIKQEKRSNPLDPSGAPLYIESHPLEWLNKSVSNVDKEYGEGTFMLSHHQNCDGISWMGWGDIREMVKAASECTKIGVCQNHPEYKVPVISTMAFMGAEAWCPFCGSTYGMFGISTVENTPILEAKHRWYKHHTQEFLKTRSRAVCSTLIWEGREIRPDQLPKEERIRMQEIIDRFKYGIKAY